MNLVGLYGRVEFTNFKTSNLSLINESDSMFTDSLFIVSNFSPHLIIRLHCRDRVGLVGFVEILNRINPHIPLINDGGEDLGMN